MEHYRKLVNRLTGELGMHEQADGFFCVWLISGFLRGMGNRKNIRRWIPRQTGG